MSRLKTKLMEKGRCEMFLLFAVKPRDASLFQKGVRDFFSKNRVLGDLLRIFLENDMIFANKRFLQSESALE